MSWLTVLPTGVLQPRLHVLCRVLPCAHTHRVSTLLRTPAAAAAAADAADKAVSGANKALSTKGLSTPSVPKPVKKAFTPPSRPKKDIGIGAGEPTFLFAPHSRSAGQTGSAQTGCIHQAAQSLL